MWQAQHMKTAGHPVPAPTEDIGATLLAVECTQAGVMRVLKLCIKLCSKKLPCRAAQVAGMQPGSAFGTCCAGLSGDLPRKARAASRIVVAG